MVRRLISIVDILIRAGLLHYKNGDTQLIYFEQLFSAQLGKMLDYQFHMGFPHK